MGSVADLDWEDDFTLANPENLVPVTTLGRGSYGKVVLASITFVEKENKEALVAVKVVAKSRLKGKSHIEKAISELGVMQQVKSRFLVRSLGAFRKYNNNSYNNIRLTFQLIETDDALYYTMPYSSGGELFFHLQRMGKFRESRARVLIQHVVLGLEHLHQYGILYRDLKPENILITAAGRAQIADFGLAKFLPRLSNNSASNLDHRKSALSVESGSSSSKPSSGGGGGVSNFFSSLLRRRKSESRKDSTFETGIDGKPVEEIWGTTKTRCGTPAYQAPEIVLAPEGQMHGLEADWWALGVLSYEIMVGDPPFMAQSIKEVYELIVRNKIVFPKKLSETAQQFILDLTKSDRKQRLGYGHMDATSVKAHPFFKADKAPSWESVENWQCAAPLDLSEINMGASPRDAVFFHAEFTSEDVREYLPPATKSSAHGLSDFKGFLKVPNESFEKFTSPTPVMVITKADAAAAAAEGDDEKKNLK